MRLLISAAMPLSSQKKMAQHVVGRKQLLPPRVVVEPWLTIFPHTNVAVSLVLIPNTNNISYVYNDERSFFDTVPVSPTKCN